MTAAEREAVLNRREAEVTERMRAVRDLLVAFHARLDRTEAMLGKIEEWAGPVASRRPPLRLVSAEECHDA